VLRSVVLSVGAVSCLAKQAQQKLYTCLPWGVCSLGGNCHRMHSLCELSATKDTSWPCFVLCALSLLAPSAAAVHAKQGCVHACMRAVVSGDQSIPGLACTNLDMLTGVLSGEGANGCAWVPEGACNAR
jgi:hypothetical protein